MMDLLENNRFLSFLDYAIVGNKLYFSNDTFNAFVEVSMDTGEVTKIEPFVGCPLLEPHLHSGCIAYQNQLFFFSLTTTRIHVLDLQSGEQKVIPKMDIQGGFTEAVIYENQLYFLPSNRVITMQVYDVQKEMLQPISWWKLGTEMNETRYHKMDENMWIGYVVCTGKYFLIDFDRQTFEERKILRNFYRMGYENGEVWFAPDDSRDVYRMSIMEETEKRYPFPDWDLKSPWGERQYMDICVAEGKVFLISGDTSGIYLLEQSGKKMELICDLSAYRINNWIQRRFEIQSKKIRDCLVYTFRQRNLIIKIELATMRVECIELDWKKQPLAVQYMNRLNYMDRVTMSEDRASLEEYLELFQTEESC